MARPQSKGLKYLNLDVSFLQDRKVRRLIRRNGENAPLVYIALLCTIYTEGYYIKWDEDTALDLADATRMDEAYVQNVIEGCLEVGLLSQEMFDENKILTSHGIQKQYQAICEQCKRKTIVEEYSLLVSSEETQQNGQEQEVSSEEMPQRKEKESKEEKKREKNISSSCCSSSFESAPTSEEEEKQQQSFVLNFFLRNWQEPMKEFYKKFIPWNSSAGRKWSEMDNDERVAAMIQWTQKPSRQPRFSQQFLGMWEQVVCKLMATAPNEVIWAALDDGLRWEKKKDRLYWLYCHQCLCDYLEHNLDSFKPIIYQHYGKTELAYILDDKKPDGHADTQ